MFACKKVYFLISVVAVIIFSVNPLYAAIINVPADQPTIQDAIDATTNGDTVIVAAETYFENINFSGKLITVKSLTGPENTIIDGNASGSVVSFISGEDNNAKLEGFTVTNGSATYGGGIRIDSSSPTITNCIIRDNVGDYGGGIDCTASASLVIEDCIIADNEYYIGGGGIALTSSSPTITDCEIKGNNIPGSYVAFGGGIYANASSPSIENCTIDNNEGYYGGGIYCSYTSTPAITDSIINNNYTASSHGGGIVARYAGCSITVTNCVVACNDANNNGGGLYIWDDASALIKKTIISGNRSGSAGGGIHNDGSAIIEQCHIIGNIKGGIYSGMSSDLTVINCAISKNSGNSSGGGIFCYNASINNCTFTENQATSVGGGIYVYSGSTAEIVNSILWGNTDGTGSNQITSSGTINITYSDIEGGWSGTGNINDDPLLLGTRLTSSSPCIDAGTITGAPIQDIEGDTRPLGSGIDMGSDEFSGAPLATLHVPADYDTIQEAIYKAKDGDTVLVDRGTYYENICFLGKIVTVKSQKGYKQTTIDGGGNGSVIKLRSGEDCQTILDGFTITNGYAKSGGGISCSYYSSPVIKNCHIAANSVLSSGGGIYLYSYSSPKIINTNIVNNNIMDNFIEGFGSGIYCNISSSPDIINCTISGNYMTHYNNSGIYCWNQSSPHVVNSILWDNFNSEIYLQGASITVSYSDVKGGYTGTGNIDIDPLFADPRPPSTTPANDGDYHLQIDSPCIDMGTKDTITYPDLPLNDIDGNYRPFKWGYDMGADEYAIEYPKLISWNGNLVADFRDVHGLNYYNVPMGWNNITGWGNVNQMLEWDDGATVHLVVDFGNGRGLRRYDGTTWTPMTDWDNVSGMTTWGNNLAVDFGAGRGLYNYNGSWIKITGWDTANAMAWWNDGINDFLIVDFGSGRGTYSYNGTVWNKMTSWCDVEHMTVYNDGTSDILAVDFGSGQGLFTYDGTWTKITGWDTAHDMVAFGNKLSVDFGSGRGLFTYDGTWTKITGWDTSNDMTEWYDGTVSNLVVDFANNSGLKSYDGSWHSLTGWDNTIEMQGFGTNLGVDFGPGTGVYSYDGSTWAELTIWSTTD